MNFVLKKQNKRTPTYFRTRAIHNNLYYHSEKSYKCGDKIRIDNQKDSHF